jgi:O-antigen/teichoic acid export membrane protein
MLKNKKSKETINNFSWRVLQIFGKQGVTFMIFFISAYFLTTREFGLFGYLMAIVSLLMIFCDFGISTATSKYVAEYKSKKDKNINKILFSSLILILGITAIISFFIILLGKNIFNENYIYILYFLPYLFLVPLASVLDGIYSGLKEFKKLSIISCLVGLFVLGTSYFLIKNYLFFGAIISQNLLYLLLVLFLILFEKNWVIKFDKIIFKKIGKYSFLIGLSSVGYFLYSRIDIIILGNFNFFEEIGYYEIINKLFQLSLILFSTFGIVIAPNMIERFVKKKYNLIFKDIKKTIITSFLLGLILSSFFIIIIPFIINLFLNQYYTPDFLLIFYLFLLTLPLAIVEAVLAKGFITPLGYIKILTITILIGGILNVFLDIIFINLFGFLGVILTTVIIHNIFNSIKIIWFYQKFKKLTYG